MTCAECPRVVYARGLCRLHYMRAWRAGLESIKELPRQMSEVEAAWVAGLFEGEGYAGLTTKGTPEVTLRMTDEDVIRRLREVVGAGAVRTYAPTNPKHKMIYTWSKSGREFVDALYSQLEPWLMARRRARFEDILGKTC